MLAIASCLQEQEVLFQKDAFHYTTGKEIICLACGKPHISGFHLGNSPPLEVRLSVFFCIFIFQQLTFVGGMIMHQK